MAIRTYWQQFVQINVICGCFVMLGCGQAAVDGSAESQARLKTVELKPDGHGDYVSRVFYQTQEQRAREVKARQEYAQRKRDGVEATASVAELSRDVSCTDNDGLWVWSEEYELGTRCCISGSGNGTFGSREAGAGYDAGGYPHLACGFNYGWSFWGGVFGGEFINSQQCSSWYGAWDRDNVGCAWSSRLTVYTE